MEAVDEVPVDEAHIRLYTKFRQLELLKWMSCKNYTLDSFQTLHIQHLHMIAGTNITKLVLHGLSGIKPHCFIQGVYMHEWSYIIMDRSSNKVGLLHDTFQIGI